jgi:RNA polymerase sigma-70 factor (ECF subfamily)
MRSLQRHQKPTVDGASLVAAIHCGDLSGLGVLFDHYGDDVHRFLVRIGISTSDVDDLVQQTFLDVLIAAKNFRADAAVRPWLFGIAAMVARRHRRGVGRMFDRLRRWAVERVVESPPTPDECFELGAQTIRAQRALEALSLRKREAFVLVVLEGLAGEEAATALGIPVATVWTRVHHARRELRIALEESS